MKGVLSKGSVISKSVHPLPEVEEYKRKLLERKILKDMGTHYVLKKGIQTGQLMAINLHFGEFMSASPFKQDIFITSGEAVALDGKLPEKTYALLIPK